MVNCFHNPFNVGTYESRQRYFNNKSAVKYPERYNITKTPENYGLLYFQVVQKALKSVAESFSCLGTLEKLAKQGKLNKKPILSKYRSKGECIESQISDKLKRCLGIKLYHFSKILPQ
ncbi:MAG: hypothetical protein WBA89_10950 [Microcoleus sp.]|uniref:hypothetical protein n=1 Tax=Microcoleus sp. TaxID=44472 RepID=UPI003C754CB1